MPEIKKIEFLFSILREVGKHGYKVIMEILTNSQKMAEVQKQKVESICMSLVILHNIVTNRNMYLETIRTSRPLSTPLQSAFCPRRL